MGTFVDEFGRQYPLLDIEVPDGFDLFRPGTEAVEFDLYWIVYKAGKLTRQVRSELKAAGWHLQRHSRTNQEMWVFDRVDWAKKKEMDACVQ